MSDAERIRMMRALIPKSVNACVGVYSSTTASLGFVLIKRDGSNEARFLPPPLGRLPYEDERDAPLLLPPPKRDPDDRLFLYVPDVCAGREEVRVAVPREEDVRPRRMCAVFIKIKYGRILRRSIPERHTIECR